MKSIGHLFKSHTEYLKMIKNMNIINVTIFCNTDVKQYFGIRYSQLSRSVSMVTVKDPNPFRVSNRTASYLEALNCMSPFLRLRSVHSCIIVASICTFKGRVQVELHRGLQRYCTTPQELNYWGGSLCSTDRTQLRCWDP
jgi:hypothetical protein